MRELLLVKAEVGALDWLPLAAILAFYGACVLALLAAGRHRTPVWLVAFFERIADSLERLTGVPGWAMAGGLSGLAFLLVAVIGLYWDVAWHVDLGRDQGLFTPPHVMILVGLGGLVYAGVVAMIFATVQQADVGARLWRPARIPWSSLPLVALGAGAFVAFPVDALWHQAFGLDVTLWSPTHLQLITGGSLATLAVWLMLAEAMPRSRPTWLGRLIHTVTAGAALVGLSTYQGEFDFGAPQFQLLFLPLLVVAAAGFVLVTARIALGPWGALRAVGVYLVLRVGIGLLVTQAFGLSTAGMPLYLGAAVCVELVALAAGTAGRLRFGLLAGAAVGTAGLALEVPWLHAIGWPLATDLLPKVAVLCPVLGMAAAVLGAGMSRAFSAGHSPLRPAVLVAAAAAAGGALLVPLPRTAGDVAAVISVVDPAQGSARVAVQLQPVDAADGATLFGVSAWQGGGRVGSGFTETAPGQYVSTDSVPVGGAWKTVIGLQRGDEVMAAPVAMPADEDTGAPAIPLLARRQTRFVANTDLLMPEPSGDHPGIRLLGYGSLVGWLLVWAVLLVAAARRIEPPAPAAPRELGRATPAPSRDAGRLGAWGPGVRPR